MAADLEADRQQRARLDAARDVRLGLAEFAEDERFDDELDTALERYWNDYYSAANMHLMSPSEEDRFLDWFTFDYVTALGDKRVIELYREERAEKLSSLQRELLDRWVDAPAMSGYALLSYELQTLHLREMLSGSTCDLFEPAGHGGAPLGSLLLGRPVSVDDRMEFYTLPAYIPPEEIADLPEKLAAARAADPTTDDVDFMRRHNVLLIHHALEQARLAGRPPVARLDPHRAAEGLPSRSKHQRMRIKGPAAKADTVPHMAQTRRKAI